MVTIYSKATKGLIAVIFIIFLASLQAIAQNEVAIGSTTTKSNAILWLNGNGSQGLILPVVTDKSAVSNPDKGMIVYDNADNKVWYRSDNAWVEVGGGGGGTSSSLNLQLQGNQLQLRDGTTTLSTVNIASGTQTNGAFMVFSGGSWQYATLSGDVNGANGALQVDGIKGKAIPALPSTTQVLVYDGTAWKFQALTSSDSQDLSLNTTTNSLSLTNDATPVDLTPYKQNLTLTGNNLGISGGNSVVLPASGTVTSVTAGTGLVPGTITTTGTVNVDVGTTANKIVQLDGTGKLPAVDGSQLTNLAGDISGVTAGAGLTGGATTGNATLTVDAGTTANKIVQLDGTGKLPAVDGSQLTNLAGDISGVTAGAGLTGGATTGNATLTVDVGTTANKIVQLDGTGKLPAVDGSQLTNLPAQVEIGDISGVTAGAGLTGGATTGNATLTVDVGTTANKVVQLDGTGKLPAVDGSQLTNLPVSGGDITDVLAGIGLTGGGSNGAVTINLANTAVTAASYGSATAIPQITVDGQGRITNATTIAPADNSATNEIQNLSFTGTGTATTGESFPLNISSGTGVTIREGANVQIDQAANVITINSIAGSGTVTNVTGTAPISVATGTTTPVISLANTAVTPGPYGTTVTIPQITVDAQGRITGASNQTIPTANTTTTGLLNNTDWNTFNSKGSGTVTSVTGSGPISVATGTTTPAISIAQANTTTNGYLSSADWNTFNSKGSGTVTAVSVATANGFGGTSSGGVTPALTLSTSVSGILKGNGTALSAAIPGTDFLAPNLAIVPATNTKITYDAKGLVTSGTTLAASDIPNIAETQVTNLVTDLAGKQPQLSGTGFVKATGTTISYDNSTYLTAYTETDPSVTAINGLVKSNGTALSAATAGTDYVAPNAAITGTTATKITYDAKGLVTSGTTLAAGDIPNIAESQVTNLVADLASKQTAFGSQIQNTFYSAPSGAPGVPAFRAIVAADIPTLNQSTTGNAATVTTNANLTGPVTSVGNATAIANGVITNAMLANAAVANLSGTNTGDQTNITGNAATVTTNANLTGPVTSVGNATAIANGAITNAMLANAAVANLSGTNTGDQTNITGNAATVTTNANLTGPVTSIGNATAIADGAVSGGTGGTITDLTIDNNDIATNAAIDGTKVAPAFGAQNISTTGTLTTGTTGQFVVNATGNIIRINDVITSFPAAQGAAATILTNDGAGNLSWAANSPGAGWGTSGNAGITDADYIGPNTLVPFNIKINNVRAGRIDQPNLNAFFGYEAGRDNAGAQGVTAFGNAALRGNTYGHYNTAYGKSALFTFSFNNGNTAFNSHSTAIGYESLYNTNPIDASTGNRNTAIGSISGYYNTTGYNNVFVGYGAGSGTTAAERHSTARNSIYIGFNSGATAAVATNAIAIGTNAIVDASNKIRLGNASITVIEGEVSFSNSSDRRLKKNIKEIDYGLDFIKKLKPVSYEMKNSDVRQNWGFIAQDIEALVGTNNAVLTVRQDSLRTLGLRYTDFIAPMVKAIQEQQEEIEQLKAQLKEKNDKVSILEGSVSSMKDELENIKRVLGMEAKLKTSGKD